MAIFKNLFRWQRGRQDSGYDKMLLCGAHWPVKFDTYLIKFPVGSEIKPHTDKVKKGKHFRLNLIIKRAQLGGEFMCENTLFQSKRIKLFRPDITQHAVTKIEKGSRYILSIGWVKSD
ncbi:MULTISPECIES: 2OG-Fe(II) oxygenase [Pseudoalteromonas]|uniref:2OG-Fe(II) oxygenase n=1 Tax=Pseudoalteromonas rhizosphaerae TaxID=2518973 RepID=A0ABW8L5N4_9GAMM|nr:MULTISPECIES: 2OG-Fe(II) oxygenase [unclassified Pseudoalteromonas]MBB1303637.1 2OG-Fe(II) oxygenase [Pseudoalteromonas sp. SR44-8]MBB1419048.1 2OG-Fe(II) oxygenase [Pseudoalteromonas sp. SG44-1]MBB1478868.1 2OG-Fe(II) oxygenase [Pseudoalteromonas sp. SG41-2]